MAGWTNAEEQAILDWYFGTTAKTPPTSLDVALCQTEPTETGTINEVNYSGYVRQTILESEWNAAVAGDPSEKTNTNIITFPEVPSNTGQTAAYFALMDGATMVFGGEVTQPPGGLALNANVVPQFDAGALRVRLD